MSAEKTSTQQKVLSEKFSDLENYYADNLLDDELKQLYGEVHVALGEFRNEVFFKNVDLMDGENYYMDRTYIPHLVGAQSETNSERLKQMELFPQVLKYYERKANKS